jgi:hypothetical protein
MRTDSSSVRTDGYSVLGGVSSPSVHKEWVKGGREYPLTDGFRRKHRVPTGPTNASIASVSARVDCDASTDLGVYRPRSVVINFTFVLRRAVLFSHEEMHSLEVILHLHHPRSVFSHDL